MSQYAEYLKRKGPRASMSINLLIFMLIASHMFYLEPFAPVLGGDGTFVFYMVMLAFLFMRYRGFSIPIGTASKMKPLVWFVVGILLSFIPAYLFYGQHLYYSFIAYRRFFSLLAYPILIFIRPTRTEIKRALYAYSVIYLFFVILVTYITPGWVVLQEGQVFIDDGEIVHFLSGIEYVVVAYIFAIDDFMKKLNVNNFVRVAFFFFIIFLLQNRTTLFASVMVAVMAVLTNRTAKTRITVEVLLLMAGTAVVILGHNYFIGIWNETLYELNNPEYNRVKAVIYFTTVRNGFLSVLLGNGFISGLVNSIMQDLMREGIYNSDVGLIGMWHQFGIIPVVTILVVEIRGLSKKHTFLVRGNSLYMLLCALTISYFADPEFILWLCLYWYLVMTDEGYEEAVLAEQQRTERRILRRYRSIAG